MGIMKLNEAGTKKLTDPEIVKRVISGEKELFEILMRRHNQKLYRIVRGYINREEEILDVMQETYLKTYHKLYSFKLDSLFSTWLIRIGINEALQWLRKNKRNVNMEEDKIRHIHESSMNEDSATPETRMTNAELNALITRSIDNIPEIYRIVFIMSEVENMSQAEIADSLQISVSNVKVRQHRAKKLIKEEMFKLSKATSVFEFGNSKCDIVVNCVMNNV
jgi:RNA polymerase sigma factor (sigma-70 family)